MSLVKRHPVLAFFGLTYAISWTFFLPTVALTQGWLDPAWGWLRSFAVVGNFGPSLAGLLLTRYLYGREGLRALLRRLLPRSITRQWVLVTLLLPIAITLGAAGFGLLLGGQLTAAAYPWYAFPVIFVVIFLNAGLAEEIGWRGFALPHLQQGRNALVSSVILGVVWALWHLPAWWFPGSIHQHLNVPLYIVGTIGLTLLLTWVYNATDGSLLAVVLMHTATNASRGVIPAAAAGSVPLEVVTTWIAVLLVMALANPRHLARHPAARTGAD